MTRSLVIALVQAPAPTQSESFAERFAVLAAHHPSVKLWVFPEFHLEPVGSHADPLGSARTVGSPSITALGRVAREHGVWLIPGSFYELGDGGAVHNTAVVFAPTGELVATYRKLFPWRPAERTAPGNSFEVFDMPGYGRVGLSICYDIWFPEHTRSLAWMGADLVLNLVYTATSDREQELVIVRGNAIMNQLWVASVNAASPTARGRSLLVDPNGTVQAASPDASEHVLTAMVDFAATAATREHGTAGVTRPWSQFEPGDAPIELPIYGGRITPTTWHPDAKER